MEVTSEVVGAATVPLELLGAPGWAPGIWLPGTVAAWLPGLVVRAIGTAFITATSCIAMAGFSSLAGLGGVVTATTIVVVGNGSRPDGVRNGSGSAAATIRYDFCQKLLMPLSVIGGHRRVALGHVSREVVACRGLVDRRVCCSHAFEERREHNCDNEI